MCFSSTIQLVLQVFKHLVYAIQESLLKSYSEANEVHGTLQEAQDAIPYIVHLILLLLAYTNLGEIRSASIKLDYPSSVITLQHVYSTG